MDEMANQCQRDERALIVAAQGGDLDAFTELLGRHEEGVRGVAGAMVRGKHDVEDVVQEAFVRAFRGIGGLGAPHRFGPWVKQIVRNVARNVRRRRSFVSLDEVMPAASPAAEEGLSDRVSATIRALSRLTPRLREAARLAYLVGHPQRVAADRLGVGVGTIKSRLAAGRQRIRGRIHMMGDDATGELAPRIEIDELGGESMRVPVRGYGMTFGSVLAVGDVETMKFYDYPGGVLTSTDRTEVLRETELCGRACFEVLTISVDCDPPEPNVLNYFEVRDAEIAWLLRVRADAVRPEVYPDVVTEPPVPRGYDLGAMPAAHAGRVVHLRVGDVDRGRCGAVLRLDEDGTAAATFFNGEGRQVLHCRYVGPNAAYGDYGQLPDDTARVIGGQRYRRWYDTVLIEP